MAATTTNENKQHTLIMKKIILTLVMVAATTTATYAQSISTDVASTVKSVAELVKKAPSGTEYGVVENPRSHIVVKTPLGRCTIEKKEGGVSFMGMTAKVVSARNGVYRVKSSVGNFTVDTRKGTVRKD